MSATISVSIMNTEPLDSRSFRVSERLRQRKQQTHRSDEDSVDDDVAGVTSDDDDDDYTYDKQNLDDSFQLDEDDDIQIIENTAPPVVRTFKTDHLLPQRTGPYVSKDQRPSPDGSDKDSSRQSDPRIRRPISESEMNSLRDSASRQQKFDTFLISVPQGLKKSKSSEYPDSNDVRLRCHHPKCEKLVRGNYAFINHIWAHIAVESCSFRKFTCSTEIGPSPSPSFQQLDFEVICPYCFMKYETPYYLQRHISTTHTVSSEVVAATICSICDVEIDSDPKKLLRHMRNVHNARDAPFNCKLCLFGAGEKSELWKHFLTKHNNSYALMCPICVEVFMIPNTKKRNNENSGKEFYEHFLSHITDNVNDCNDCPCFFSNPAYAHEHKAREHSSDLKMKWAIRHRNDELHNNVRSQIQRVFFSGNDCPRCTTFNSKTQIKDYTPRCINCITNYIKSHCRASNYYIDRRYSVDYVYRCACGYVSRDVRDSAIHSRVHEHLQIQIEHNPIAQTVQTEQQKRADDFELDLFQIVHRPLKVMNEPESAETAFTEFKKRIDQIKVEDNLYEMSVLNQFTTEEDLGVLMHAYQFWMNEEVKNARKRKTTSENSADFKKQALREENSEGLNNSRRVSRNLSKPQISPEPPLLSNSAKNSDRDTDSSSPDIIVIDD